MGQAAGEMTDKDLDAQAREAIADSGMGAIEMTDEPEVEALVDDIEVTRDEMTVTVEQIGDRLDPRNIVEGAKETVRAATVGKVEDMANNAGAMVGDAGETVREAGSGIIDTITRNPIPAAMVGIGLGWLMKNGRPSSAQRWSGYAGRSGIDPYAPGRYASDRSAREGASPIDQVQQKAGQVVDRVGQTVGGAAGQVGSTVGEATDQVGQFASQVPYQVQSTAGQLGADAGRIFEQNPLAVGAIAVAVGTAVGLVLPASEIERRAIQQPARQVIAKAEDVATDALGQVEQTARDAEQQAREEERLSRPH